MVKGVHVYDGGTIKWYVKGSDIAITTCVSVCQCEPAIAHVDPGRMIIGIVIIFQYCHGGNAGTICGYGKGFDITAR